MIFLKKRYFLNLFLSFFIAKLISCLLVIKFLSIYDSRIFVFTDLIEYNEAPKGFILTPNFLYAYFIRLIGYDTGNLLSPSSIFVSFLFSLIFFIPWVFLGSKILNKKSSFFYSILIGLHPYLALYSLKIDSTSFSIIPVALFVINQFLPKYKLKLISLWTSILSSFLRSQTIILAWIQALYFLPKYKFKISIKNISFFFALVLLVLCSLSQYDYGSNILTENFGCYSFLNIKNFFISRDINKNLSHIFSFLVTPIVHIFLLFGAREAIGVYCINLPKEIANNAFINIASTIVFFSFHFSLFIKMLVWIFKKNYKKRFIGLLIPFILIIPNLYGAAHMRYILFLIPYLMFWLFEIQEEKIDLFSKKY